MNLTPRIHSRNDVTPMEPNTNEDARQLLNADRASAERALHTAEDKPILSGEQSCAVAQVHALLAIEQRLGQLAASIDAILIALAHPGPVGADVVPTGAR